MLLKPHGVQQKATGPGVGESSLPCLCFRPQLLFLPYSGGTQGSEALYALWTLRSTRRPATQPESCPSLPAKTEPADLELLCTSVSPSVSWE